LTFNPDLLIRLSPKNQLELARQRAEQIQAAKTSLNHRLPASSWIQQYFVIPETKGPMALAPYQVAVLDEALRPDADGNFRYSTIVWSDIKKSIKSCIAAAVGLWRAFRTEWGSVYAVANDLKQANSRVGYYMRRAVELHPGMRSLVRINNYRLEFPNHAFIESVPIDPTGEAGSNADMVIFCLDDQTEIMTRDGWKGWESLSPQDEVATLSVLGAFEWQKPTSIYCRDYRGPMLRLDTNRFSMCVTPDHRVYGKFLKNPNTFQRRESALWETRTAAEAAASPWFWPRLSAESWVGEITSTEFVLPATRQQPEYKIPLRLWVRFLAWFLAEGSLIQKHGEKPYGVVIAQSVKINPEKRKDIEKLLTDMGLPWRAWGDGMNVAIWNLSLGEYCSQFGKSGDKFIPGWLKNLPVEYLNDFLQTYISGDGYKVGNGFSIVTNSWKMRDDLEEIGQKCGYIVADWAYVDSRWGGRTTQYTTRLIRSHSLIEIKKKKWETVVYTGKVFCPSTKSGVIFVRRRGKCYWTGNSELWGAHQESQSRMWTEMTLSPTKFGQSFRWVETYAGYSGQSVLLEQLYQTGIKEGVPLELGIPDLEVYSNPAARMLTLWNTHPRLPWQTPEYYAEEEATLIPNEFRRIHKNEFISPVEKFIPDEWWAACHFSRQGMESLPERRARQPVIVSLDAGISNDHFGLVAGYRWKANVVPFVVMEWVPPKGGGKIDFGGPEKVCRQLAKDYNVVEFAYDEFQLHDMASRLRKDGVGYFRPFPQGVGTLRSPGRPIADKFLYDLIQQRRIIHEGSPILTAHIGNADAEVEGKRERMRLVKRAAHMKIDCAVCLSQLASELFRLNAG